MWNSRKIGKEWLINKLSCKCVCVCVRERERGKENIFEGLKKGGREQKGLSKTNQLERDEIGK